MLVILFVLGSLAIVIELEAYERRKPNGIGCIKDMTIKYERDNNV